MSSHSRPRNSNASTMNPRNPPISANGRIKMSYIFFLTALNISTIAQVSCWQ